MLAAKAAGIETVAWCESDPACQLALRKLWPDVIGFEDVRHVSTDALCGNGIEPGTIDLISGGFPCQDISTAGKGAGIEGKRSGLWYEMLRIIEQARPRWVLAENVPALKGRGADTVLAGLEAAGYTAWPLVVGAWAFGAPHKRGPRVDRGPPSTATRGTTGRAGRSWAMR
jgi:DNA (cytosine-5)-methyltransferase 1